MLAYASKRPVAAKRQSSPHAMLLVISAHVALLAAVMSAKMELPRRMQQGPGLIRITLVPPSTRPPPPRGPKPRPMRPVLERPQARIEPTLRDSTPVEAEPSSVDAITVGGGPGSITEFPQPTAIAPVRHDPRLLTPPSELKPPYPASKLASEEEARLTLRLAIDDRGRVIGVYPVGYADREFLDAARRYILAHWRFEPATEDGRPIAATTVITLSFQLDG